MIADISFTRSELLTALMHVEHEVASFFDSLSAAELSARSGEAWTAAEHLDHLNTAVSAVARGMSVAPWMLRLRFGRASGTSRPYAQIRETYRARLASGAGASGVFVPVRRELDPSAALAHREALLARWARVNARLRASLDRWSEAKLDTIRLPHPILGMLTVREMLFFTVYHNQHHIEAAKRRLPRFTPGPGDHSSSAS